MIIQILANGAALAVSLWLAHRSFGDGVLHSSKRKRHAGCPATPASGQLDDERAIWSPPRAFAGIVDDFAPRHDLPKASCADAQPSSSPSFQNRPSLLVCRIAAIGGPGSAGHEALGLGDLARCSSRYCGSICFLPLSKCAQDCHVKIDDFRQAGQLLKRPSCVKKVIATH